MLCQSLAGPGKTTQAARHVYLIYEKVRFPVRISEASECVPSLMSAPLESAIEIPATKMGTP